MSDKPTFKHDCSACTFLGTWMLHDLYFCTRGPGATVIARYGDDGPDYSSGLAVAHLVPELDEAKRRAIARGLIK